MDTSLHDVLLVGGGGAGLRAAIAAAEVNPKLSIAVISKVYPMRSHTVSAEGAIADYRNGVLRVALPKRTETKARRIEIKGDGAPAATIEAKAETSKAAAK